MVSKRTKEYFEERARQRNARVAMEIALRRAFESRVDASTQTECELPDSNDQHVIASQQQPTSPSESELLRTPDEQHQPDDTLSIHPAHDWSSDEQDVRKVKSKKKKFFLKW